MPAITAEFLNYQTKNLSNDKEEKKDDMQDHGHVSIKVNISYQLAKKHKWKCI